MVVGGLAPPVMKLIGKAPKLGKAATVAKSTKFMKVLKFGKGAVALSAAIAVIELLVGMASAQAINKQLKKDMAVLNKHIDEADAEIAELKEATSEAEGLVKSLLKDSDLGDLEHDAAIAAYVRMMNEAIAGLSAQKAKIRMVRKMVLHGVMEPADIAAMTDVDEAVVESIEKRVRVERALVEGRSVVEAARETGLEADQVIEIEGVVRARNEAVAGEDAEKVAEILKVPVAVVLGEGEATFPLLAPSWAEIETDGDLIAIGRKAVLSADALGRLRNELRAKSALASGGSPEDVAASSGRPIEDIAEWGLEVAEGRSDIAILKRDGKLGKPSLVAAQMRLPLSLVA
jgi:cell division protein FtsL